MADHSSAWEIPGKNRGAWQATVHGITKESDMTQQLNSNKYLTYSIVLDASWEICMQVRKQQLELVMEQQTGSK